MDKEQIVEPPRGVAEAVARYGQPVERKYTYPVSRETLLYWESILRKRAAEVVLLLRRPNGRYLVHTKAFYSPGVYRLLSGGIKPGEDLLMAVRREAWEETGLEVRIERFLGVIQHVFSYQGKSLPFTSYLFLVAEEGGTLGNRDPEEAISAYREIEPTDLLRLAEELEMLPPQWADWGRFRATPHRLAAEVLHGTMA
jgi:8-oxo-dGTP pyrophosphatase MutT (NUDIX family)